MISVGASQKTDTAEAAAESAQMAMASLADSGAVAFVLAFCGNRHQPDVFFNCLRTHFGDAVIVGGAAIGAITGTTLGYVGYECAIAVFSPALPSPTIIVEYGLDQGELAVGRRIGERLRDITHDGDSVLLFYDSIQSSPPPVLNIGSQLMDGIYEGLAGTQPHLIGAGLAGDFQLTTSFVFDGRQTGKQVAVAIALPSVLRAHTIIMHGCYPASSFLEITKSEGAVIYELNGRPATEVLYERLGVNYDTLQPDQLSLRLTLGKKYGDPFAPYNEAMYVNRLIMGADLQAGTVTLFEADFEEGEKVQVMARDNHKMLESVRQNAPELVASLGMSAPVFALYIDCAGRASAFSGCEIEEAGILQTELGPKVPLLGFYSGVEIAPLVGRSRPLDWTGVFTVFTLDDAYELSST